MPGISGMSLLGGRFPDEVPVGTELPPDMPGMSFISPLGLGRDLGPVGPHSTRSTGVLG